MSPFQMDGIVNLRAEWILFVLFVCLFGVFRPTRGFFTHMETSPSLVKGCEFWPVLGIHGHWAVHVGSLTCHTYCDTRHPFIIVISEDLWHTCCWAFSSGAVTTKVCRGWDSNTQPSSCEVNALAHCATAAVAELMTAPVFEKLISRTLYLFKTAVRVSDFKKTVLHSLICKLQIFLCKPVRRILSSQ